MTDETDPIVTEGEGTAAATEENKPEKLKQAVEIKDIGPCKKHIKVTIERTEIDGLFDEKISELVNDSQIPGFRPGKAPRKVVVHRFRKEVSDQIKGQILLASLEQLAEDHDVAPLSAPELNPGALEIPKEGPFVYEFSVEVRPEFDLPNYKGLKIKRPIKTFTEEEIEKEEHRILARYGQLVPKPEGNADIGDFLTVDMSTKHGDKELGTAREVTLRIDETLAFKDGLAEKFAEQVKGAKPGDKRVVDIVLSDAVGNEQLRGQKVQATLEIKDVKKLRLPELTHEFLHNFGVHTPEQLREQVAMLLERRLQYEQRRSAREQVLKLIVVSSEWDLPRDLLLRQAKRSLQRRVMEMRESGISEDEITARLRVLQQDVVASTALALKEHFVLQKIAETEKIDVSNEDIDDEIERLADQSDESPRRVRAQLEKEDMMETLAAQLIERKALDLILDNAEYEDVPLGQEKAVAAVDEQAIAGELADPTAAPPEEKPAEEEKS